LIATQHTALGEGHKIYPWRRGM